MGLFIWNKLYKEVQVGYLFYRTVKDKRQLIHKGRKP